MAKLAKEKVREYAIPAKAFEKVQQAAANIQQAQGAFNAVCDLILDAMDVVPNGKVNVNFDKKVFEVDNGSQK